MNSPKLFELLVQVINEMEKSGDIVVVNPIENSVPKTILSSIEKFVPSMLSRNELIGIENAIGAHQLGFGLDDRDFQTIIGLTKEELDAAAEKLKACHE